MSEKPFTTEEFLRRLRQVPELAYEFTAEEVQKATEEFLQYVGYELQPPSPIGSTQPDFHAKRQVGEKVFEIVGLISPSLLEGMPEMMAKIRAMKAILGDKVDYVLVFPPISERRLLDFLRDNKGEWYFKIQGEDLMLWLCNPEQETMWCLMGSPRDKLFHDYFVMPKLNIDAVIGAQLSRELMEEEN